MGNISKNTNEMLKALEEEIERVNHQINNSWNKNERKRLKKYLKHLKDLEFEIPFLHGEEDE